MSVCHAGNCMLAVGTPRSLALINMKKTLFAFNWVKAMGVFVFEPTCAHARWALRRRLLSIRPSVRDKY